jgi:hypothetical protein
MVFGTANRRLLYDCIVRLVDHGTERKNAWPWVETLGLYSYCFYWFFILLLHVTALGRCHCFISSLVIASGLSCSF